MKDFSTALISLLVFVIVTAFLFAGWNIVDPGTRGVAVTMGKVDPEFRGEGFTLKLPVFTKIVPISIQESKAQGEASCFSSDLQTVEIKYTVLYKLPEAKVVTLFQQYQNVGKFGFEEGIYDLLVDSRVQEAMKQVTANYPAEKLVKSREEIKTLSLQKIRPEVGDVVSIIDLNIANIDLSNQLEKAIEEKMVQEQESLAMKFKLEKANKEAEITIVSSKAEAESVRIKGEAIAKSPDVIQLEIVKKWNGISPSTVVVGGTSSGASVLLPLAAAK